MTTPTCTGCGRCCHNQSSPPFMPDELDALPASLNAEVIAYLDGPDFDDSKPCLWLTSEGACRNYEHRPEICRDYRLANEACHRERIAVGLSIEGWPIVSEEEETHAK